MMIKPIAQLIKDPKDQARILSVHPLLLGIICEMSFWCQTQGIPFLITSTLSDEKEDAILGRVSVTHRQGRAIDLSVKGWTPQNIISFQDYFNKKHGKHGAINSKGDKRLIVYHVGTAAHFHIQIASKYLLESFKK